MKKLSLILSISFLLSPVFTLRAAVDTTDININATFIDYLNFTGSAAGTSRFYSIDDIEPAAGSSSGAILSLGELGLESNFAGDCDIEFSAKNNFRLRHTVSNVSLTSYRIRWKGEVMSGNPVRTNKFTMACNSAPTEISFQAVASFLANTRSGIYQDVITISVTTQ